MSETLTRIQALLALTQTEFGIANTRQQVAFPPARLPQIRAQIVVIENALAAAQAAEAAGNAPAVAAELANAEGGRAAAAASYDGGWANSHPLYLGDIGQRERRREIELRAERHTLERLLIGRGEGQRDAQGKFQPLPNGPETAALRQWRKLDALLGEAVLDPLVRNTIRAGNYANVQLVRGMFRRFASAGDAPKTHSELSDQEREFVAVLGILLRERAGPDDDDQINQRFASSVAKAQGEYRANKALFDAVLKLLADSGRRATDDVGEPPTERDWLAVPKVAEVTIGDLARIVKELARRGVRHNDVYLETYVDDLVSNTSGIGDGAEPASVNIALPDLDGETDIEIVKENLHAMQCIYFSATLEDLKLFSVCDKLVESFHQGMLPIGRGTGGNLLYQYWKRSLNRFTEVERRNLYARAFGFPGGDVVTGTPNREFTDLWLRFVSAVAEFDRQLTVNDLVTSRTPVSVTQERVRKAGRDLAANLSLYGYGVAYFAATELQEQIKDILAILNDVDVRSSYGARDVWQVVDQVATLELGGARNSVRYRTMANAGAIIIRWLSNNAEGLASVGRARLLDPASLNSDVDDPTRRPLENPSNRDLVDACQQWLAVTGTQDAQIEEFSQSVEGPTMTSRPIQIPAIARELLDSAGIAPMSMQHN